MREQWDCPVRMGGVDLVEVCGSEDEITGVEAHEAMHDALGPEPAP